ncbi:hypothetical protein [Emticicia sp. BO119]|uniref:hypothetical protein n=1 Tax=Emticicia sp. BO119 TaxID=2757768 RepID=UPI0015F0F5E3|nr:hypothetical protein [Emticicia sp. BO119]MBA4851469.1 hypothetical protein [Emticicia sp. BO119]
MEIINIPTAPEDFLELPMHSHVSLFYEKYPPPYDTYESKKHSIIIFRIDTIQLSYTHDILDYIKIDFSFKQSFTFKFNSIEVDRSTSYDDIRQIIADGNMEYMEHVFSENQLNMAINHWALFIFDIQEEGTFLYSVAIPFSMDSHRALFFNDPPKKGR